MSKKEDKTLVQVLTQTIENLNKTIEEQTKMLKSVMEELNSYKKGNKDNKSVITSGLTEEKPLSLEQELSTPGMTKAVNMVLVDWERQKERQGAS